MSLSDAVYDQHVFDGGPPLRLQRSLGLVKPEQPRILRRALFSATIAWVPLALATAAQTTTDYFSVAANVYEVRELPFTIKDLIGPVIPALVPFLFVALLKVPFQVILDSLIKLWF